MVKAGEWHSAEPCQSSALISFIGIIVADRGAGFPCTPSRSPCHCPETCFLKLSLVVAFLPTCIWCCQIGTFVPDGCAWPHFVLTVSSVPFYPDEQQKVEQFPPSHPAGEQEAVQQGPAGGDGAEPLAEADPACGVRDAPARDRPQVVLRQLHLLPPALVHDHHHYCRGKCPPWNLPTLPKPLLGHTQGLERDSFRPGQGQTWSWWPLWLPVGVCSSGDCDPVVGTICMWDYTVWETRAKLFEEWKQDSSREIDKSEISIQRVERKSRGDNSGLNILTYSCVPQMGFLHICWVMCSSKCRVGYDTDSRVLTGSRFLWLKGCCLTEDHK